MHLQHSLTRIVHPDDSRQRLISRLITQHLFKLLTLARHFLYFKLMFPSHHVNPHLQIQCRGFRITQ